MFKTNVGLLVIVLALWVSPAWTNELYVGVSDALLQSTVDNIGMRLAGVINAMRPPPSKIKQSGVSHALLIYRPSFTPF